MIYNDIDIETRNLEDEANWLDSLEKRGICTHRSMVDHTCEGCGIVFLHDGDWCKAMRDPENYQL